MFQNQAYILSILCNHEIFEDDYSSKARIKNVNFLSALLRAIFHNR